MVDAQIINKILASGSLEILENYNLSLEYFPVYEAELQFILNHVNKYGNVPNRETFISNFEDFKFTEVSESDDYLVNTIREEYLYAKSAEAVQKYAALLQNNAVTANEYLHSVIEELTPSYGMNAVDIIKSSKDRYEEWVKRQGQENLFISTGFSDLDYAIKGWSKLAEELVILFARTGQGKSWILDYFLTHAFKSGERPGLFTPEMSIIKMGYRIDTLMDHFSNSGLTWGLANRVNQEEYLAYANKMSERSGFLAASMKDFDGKVTVSKLRNFVKRNNITILGIDGITYISDERGSARDHKRTALSNASEDLVRMSEELGVPIIAVHQSNRGGIRSDEDDSGLPDIENISESDGIAHSATKIIAIRQQKDVLTLGVKKHRDGPDGQILNYNWDIDTGTFKPLEKKEGSKSPQSKVEHKQNKPSNGKVVF